MPYAVEERGDMSMSGLAALLTSKEQNGYQKLTDERYDLMSKRRQDARMPDHLILPNDDKDKALPPKPVKSAPASAPAAASAPVAASPSPDAASAPVASSPADHSAQP